MATRAPQSMAGREIAIVLAGALGLKLEASIKLDDRVCESNLDFLTRDEFCALGLAEANGDANATVRAWMERRRRDFDRLKAAHVSLWNELLASLEGSAFVYVLHVEGLLLYTTLALGLPATALGRIQIPRRCTVHVTLFPDRDPLVSVQDSAAWSGRANHPFASYG